MNKKFMKNTDVIFCSCFSCEHQVIIIKDEDLVCLEIHLVNRRFWARVKYAFKYLFGYKSRYGAWDEIILDDTHAEQFQKLAEYLRKLNNEQNDERTASQPGCHEKQKPD